MRYQLSLFLFAAASLMLGGCTLVNGTDDWVGEVNLEDTARPECIQYCDTFMSVCVGDNAQYANRNDCLATCADISLGIPGDYSVNTVQCRLTHLQAAPADPGAHCPHAGADGGGQCVGEGASPCGAYCANFAERCPQEFAALSPDIPLFECAHECALFPTGDQFDDDYWYDSFECRDSWLEEPGPPNSRFCEFARPDDPIGCNDDDTRPDCQSLCALRATECMVDEMQCMVECAMVPEDGDEMYCALDAVLADPPRCMQSNPNICMTMP